MAQTHDEQVMIRLPAAMKERAERLAEQLAEAPGQVGRVTRAAVLREAIRRGLAAMEAEAAARQEET